MAKDKIFVFDTNALISAFLVKGSVSDRAFKNAIKESTLGISESLLSEFMEVLWRPKFDKYFTETERAEVVSEVLKYGIHFLPTKKITASSDPDDNMILELAITAQADCIISGDPHLLMLHPFRDIPILSAADFLNTF